jgi:hypothetical protein
MWVCVWLCMCVCVYVCVWVCVCVWLRECVIAWVCDCECVSVCVCVWVWLRACVCVSRWKVQLKFRSKYFVQKTKKKIFQILKCFSPKHWKHAMSIVILNWKWFQEKFDLENLFQMTLFDRKTLKSPLPHTCSQCCDQMLLIGRQITKTFYLQISYFSNWYKKSLKCLHTYMDNSV